MVTKLGQYMKAVEAFIGVLLMVGSFVLATSAHLPVGVVAGITSVLGVLTTLKVWLTKNETVVVEAVEAAVELGHGVASAGKRQ